MSQTESEVEERVTKFCRQAAINMDRYQVGACEADMRHEFCHPVFIVLSILTHRVRKLDGRCADGC